MSKLFKKTCHTTCYVFETLWSPGDVYEGEKDPGKHFSDDGKSGAPELPRLAADDPRSNAELIATLRDIYGVKMPKSRPRKVLWAKLNEMERAARQDAGTEGAAPELNVKKTTAKKK